MGEIIMCNCRCGYKKELFLGAGLNAINKNLINRIFSAKLLRKFNRADKSLELGSYLLNNILCECKKCKELAYSACLNYTVSGIPQREILSKCNVCDNEMVIINPKDIEGVSCPKCGCKLDYKSIGNWD